MAKSKNTIENRIDYSILLPVLILLLVGMVSIFIATNFDYPKNLVHVMSQQLLWIFLGSVLAFVVMLFNTEFLWKVTPWLYIFGLGLMVLPLIFYSPSLVASTGAKNWVSIGSVTLFQPSEFMKISYILFLSRIGVRAKQGKEVTELQDDWLLLFQYVAVTLPVLGLLVLQGDRNGLSLPRYFSGYNSGFGNILAYHLTGSASLCSKYSSVYNGVYHRLGKGNLAQVRGSDLSD